MLNIKNFLRIIVIIVIGIFAMIIAFANIVATISTPIEYTLDEVREFAKKGDGLTIEDFQPPLFELSSNTDRHYWVYYVKGGYRLIISSELTGKPDRVTIESVWESAADAARIDIRYDDLDEFLLANPSQDPITEEEALGIAQEKLGVELEPVRYMFNDQSDISHIKSHFANALFESKRAIGETCYSFRIKNMPEPMGPYCAVGKKSGTVFIGGWTIEWDVFSD